MDDRPFSKQARDPQRIRGAIVASIVCIFFAFFFAYSIFGKLFDTVVYILSQEGWPPTSTNPDAPLYEKLTLLFMGLAVLVPLIVLLWGIFGRLIRDIKNKFFLKNHSVVCGLGWQGQAFVTHLRSLDRGRDRESRLGRFLGQIFGLKEQVVVVELDADDAVQVCCQKLGAMLVRGNAELAKDLGTACIPSARRVYICTGSLDRNLVIVQAIARLMETRYKNPLLEISVSMGDALPDEAACTQLFPALLATTDQCHFTVYDPDRRMARCFFHHHKVYQWADEQIRPPGQPVRVHLVFLGFSRLAAELILQYSRIWPCGEHQPPLFSVVCRENKRLDEFLARHSNLQGDVEVVPYNPGDVEVRQPATDELLLSAELMKQVAEISAVTAVICCSDDSETSLQRASNVQMLSVQRVPKMVEIEKRAGTSALLNFTVRHPDPGQRIIPFGAASDYCDVELLERVDLYARAIHQQYVIEHGTFGPDNTPMPACRDWELLDPVFQRNNFRAADHIPVKLYSMGYRWNGDDPVIAVADEAPESIGKLEHESWVVEKLLDGWSFSERDDTRKLHNNIVPWDELTKDDKKKDLTQFDIVHKSVVATEQQQPTAGLPLRVALIGHNNLNGAQASSCATQFKEKFAEILNGNQNRWLELITPLAPGSDLLLAEQAIDCLKTKQYPIVGYKLRIPYAVPWNKVDDDFRSHWKANNQCHFNHPGDPDNADHWEFYKHLLSQKRDWLFEEIRKAGQAVEITNLMPAGDDVLPNSQGYINAASWIVDNADVVVAVLDLARGSSQAGEWKDGGTAQTVAQWKSRHEDGFYQIDPNRV